MFFPVDCHFKYNGKKLIKNTTTNNNKKPIVKSSMMLINSVLNKNTCAVLKLLQNLKIVGVFLAAILSNEDLMVKFIHSIKH